MPLESLLELVKTLRIRIDEHRHALSGNEMLTRYALIDPLLRELGWDTADPAIVIPEDTSGLGRGRPDYVLQNNGQPAMVIEAKKLGSGLQDGTRQAVAYAMDANRQARYFAITDGQHWEIYDTNKPASDMGVISFDLMATSSAEVCLNVLALWRPSVEAGNVSAGQSPIVSSQPKQVSEDTSVESPVAVLPVQQVVEVPPRIITAVQEPDANWELLSEVNPPPRGNPPHPKEIMFPDGSLSDLKAWNSIPTEVTRWLIRNNHLNEGYCPIQRPRAKTRSILNNKPIHQHGHPFEEPRQVESLYLDVDYNGRTLVDNARLIIRSSGQDPSQFKVRYSS